MKCPTCSAWADVKETRQRAGYKYRRYSCANGHKFSTRESHWVATTKDATLKRVKEILNGS